MSIESLANPAQTAETFSVASADKTFAKPTRGLYVGVTGDVNVEMMDNEGVAVLFVGVAAGSVLPLRVHKVLQSSTTASSMVALT